MNSFSKYIIYICLFTLFFQVGCVPEKKIKPIKKEKQEIIPTSVEEKKIKSVKQTYFIHIVKFEGESLSLISKWYIGNFEDWKLLARHNIELNPSNIHIGDRVWIPKHKMKTSKQMPESFLNKYTKKKTIPAVKKPVKKEKKPIELYGPKEHEEEHEEYTDD